MIEHSREFDVLVVGATGFTGALVAEYLCERYGIGRELRWGAVARNENKLVALRRSLGSAASSQTRSMPARCTHSPRAPVSC